MGALPRRATSQQGSGFSFGSSVRGVLFFVRLMAGWVLTVVVLFSRAPAGQGNRHRDGGEQEDQAERGGPERGQPVLRHPRRRGRRGHVVRFLEGIVQYPSTQ